MEKNLCCTFNSEERQRKLFQLIRQKFTKSLSKVLKRDIGKKNKSASEIREEKPWKSIHFRVEHLSRYNIRNIGEE